MPLQKHTHKGKLISRRVLALRMLIAQIGWLDGVPVMTKGRIGWEHGGSIYEPNAGEIARAQRRLNKILHDREAAARVVGNVTRWAEEKQQQLSLVKRLAGVSLNGSAADWVIVQAICVDAPIKLLPTPVKQSSDWLGQILNDNQLNLQIKSFAAIMAGAFGIFLPITRAFPQNDRLQTAHEFGQRVGFTSYSQFLNKVLLQHGATRATETHNILGQIKSFAPTEEALNRACFRHTTEEILRTLDDVTLLQSVPQLIAQYGRSRGGNPEQMQILAKETVDLKNMWETKIRLLIFDYGQCLAHPVHDYITLFIQILMSLRCKSSKRYMLFNSVARLLEYTRETEPKLRAELLDHMVSTLRQECDRLGVGTSTNVVHLKQKLGMFIRKLDHLPRLINLCNDRVLIRQIFEKNLGPSFRVFDLTDTESTVVAVKYLLALSVETDNVSVSVMRVIQASQTSSHLKETLSRIFNRIAVQPKSIRRWMFNSVCDWIDLENKFLPVRERFDIAYAVLCIVLDENKADSSKTATELLYPAMDAWVATRQMKPAESKACITWLVRYLVQDFAKQITSHRYLIASATLLAGIFSGGSAHIYQKIVLTCISKRVSVERQDALTLMYEIGQLPGLVKSLGTALVDDTCSFGALISKYLLARRLGISVVHLLRPLNAIDAEICKAQCCAAYRHLPAEFQKELANYNAVMAAGGASHVVPTSIGTLLRSANSNSKELRYLERQFPPMARPEKIEKRIAKLKAYRLHPDLLQKEIESAITRELHQLESRAYIQATISILRDAIRQYAFTLTGQPTETIGEDELIELALFRKRLVQNRSALRNLIKASLRGDKTWVLRQPKNQLYMKKLEAAGIATQHWLNPPSAVLRTKSVPHSPISIYVETDPLEILQMGNYFETCLSFDGINNHSPVANACDINKRVIYARDEKGKVIGRKLIAIDETFGLLGYLTYCIYTDEKRSLPIKAAIERFARNFAGLCNLPLHEDGEVDVLVADWWYDDGSVSWDPDIVNETCDDCGGHHARRNTAQSSSSEPGAAEVPERDRITLAFDEVPEQMLNI